MAGSGEKGSLLGVHRKSLQKERSGSSSHNQNHIPKGFLAVKVGQDENEQQRFVVPIMYLNHPLFIKLLNVAEEEYGFQHEGAITIPCHVEEFLYVRDLIDKGTSESSVGRHFGHNHHHSNHNHLAGCFGA